MIWSLRIPTRFDRSPQPYSLAPLCLFDVSDRTRNRRHRASMPLPTDEQPVKPVNKRPAMAKVSFFNIYLLDSPNLADQQLLIPVSRQKAHTRP